MAGGQAQGLQAGLQGGSHQDGRAVEAEINAHGANAEPMAHGPGNMLGRPHRPFFMAFLRHTRAWPSRGSSIEAAASIPYALY